MSVASSRTEAVCGPSRSRTTPSCSVSTTTLRPPSRRWPEAIVPHTAARIPGTGWKDPRDRSCSTSRPRVAGPWSGTSASWAKAVLEAFPGVDGDLLALLRRLRSLCVAVKCWLDPERGPEVREAARVHLRLLGASPWTNSAGRRRGRTWNGSGTLTRHRRSPWGGSCGLWEVAASPRCRPSWGELGTRTTPLMSSTGRVPSTVWSSAGELGPDGNWRTPTSPRRGRQRSSNSSWQPPSPLPA